MRIAAMLLGAVMVGLAGPALAEDACARPTAPAAVDGATASMDQIQAAKREVMAFITASDAYQTCVLDDLAARKKAAKAAKTKFDPTAEKAANGLVSANQADKERVGVDFNNAAKAFKAAHPS